MKKARAMLKSSSATVESIAESVGYQNVEHFNRTFKKLYNITPVSYTHLDVYKRQDKRRLLWEYR